MRTTNQRFSSLRRQPPPHSALFPTSPFLQSHPSFHSNSKKHELKKGIAFSSSNQRCLTHLTFDPPIFFFFTFQTAHCAQVSHPALPQTI